jgi:hypothetical protein
MLKSLTAARKSETALRSDIFTLTGGIWFLAQEVISNPIPTNILHLGEMRKKISIGREGILVILIH